MNLLFYSINRSHKCLLLVAQLGLLAITSPAQPLPRVGTTTGNSPVSGARLLRTQANSNTYSAPTLGDVDSDGDLDAVIGTASGTLLFYRNLGTATNPLYVSRSGEDNPFLYFDTSVDLSYSSPALGDVDGDGDLDAIIGTVGGDLVYFKNQGSATNPLYVSQSSTDNPFLAMSRDLADYSYSAPSLKDVDADGDLDAVIGTAGGALLFYKNLGTATNPLYVSQSAGDNPFNQINESLDGQGYTSPTIGDLDGDGDQDVVLGTADGSLMYYKNLGSATNPLYVSQSGPSNPFFILGVPRSLVGETFTAPTLGDVDLDGDLDVIVGTATGRELYFENTGATNSPAFEDQTNTNNPFLPDLMAVIYAQPSVVNGPTSVNVLVNLMEFNGIGTTNPVVLYISKDAKLQLGFDPNATYIPGYDTTVENNQWLFDGTSNPDYYVLTRLTSIGGGQSVSVGLSGQLVPGATQGTLTVSATIGNNNESDVTNNTDTERIDYFER
ncbi:FG-GAP-like repeat-containing protein [Spirosoma koreense]